MADRPDELDMDRRFSVTRRQALAAGGGAAMATYLAACGGSTSSSGGGGGNSGGSGGESDAKKPPTPADGQVENGDLLLANWVDYSDPANYKGYQKKYGPKVQVTGFGSNDEILAKLRAGGSKFDVISPTGYAVKTMADLGLIMPLTHELIPNLKNLEPAFTKTTYDPGNVYSVPKDYGITSFYWLDEKVPQGKDLKTIKDCFDFLKTPEAKNLNVNFLEGGTQVMAIALAALGYSINSEDEKEIEEAKNLLVEVKPNVDTINSTFIERATRGEIDFGMGWNADIRRAIVQLAKKGKKMTFLVPDGPTEYWVDNWVVPTASEHPVAAHKWIDYVLDPAVAGREMNYHQYPVPVVGIQGVNKDLANDPVVIISNDKLEGYESQIETAKSLQQRNRAYTEFKAA
jgi:spermidine/putrescine transport system substrate-binding protein